MSKVSGNLIKSSIISNFCFNFTGPIHWMFDESSAYVRASVLGTEISDALGRFLLEFSIRLMSTAR